MWYCWQGVAITLSSSIIILSTQSYLKESTLIQFSQDYIPIRRTRLKAAKEQSKPASNSRHTNLQEPTNLQETNNIPDASKAA